MEGLGDAVAGYFDAVSVFWGEGAVLQRGGEEVYDGEGEAFACFGGLGLRMRQL